MSERSITIVPTLTHQELLKIPNWKIDKDVARVTQAVLSSIKDLTARRVNLDKVFEDVESSRLGFQSTSGTAARDMAVKIAVIAREAGWDLHDPKVVLYGGLFIRETTDRIAKKRTNFHKDIVTGTRVFESEDKRNQAQQRTRESLLVYNNEDPQSQGYTQIITAAVSLFISENPETNSPGLEAFLQGLIQARNITSGANPINPRRAMIESLKHGQYEDAARLLEEMTMVRRHRLGKIR